MSLDLSALGAAEQAQLANLLAKLQPAAAESAVPAAKKRKKRRTQEIKYLTEAQVEAFFRVVTDPRDRAIFRLAYHRGLRASEIGDLQLSDYLVRDDRLIVRRLKGSAGGEYHLTSNEVRALKGYLKVRGSVPGPLFLSRVGRPISRQMLDVLVKRYGKLAGLPTDKRHMHVLKHSCATHLLNMGESLEDARDHLGHRSIKSTEVYAQYTSSRRQARDRRLRNW